MNAAQAAWLAANGITATPARVGFVFSKGSLFILPVKATASRVYLQETTTDQDSDGERNVATFDTLRDALVALLKGAN